MTNGKASVSWISNKAELRIAMQDNGEDARSVDSKFVKSENSG